ncbi:MAG TPA: four-carbon acid sugar kinase family protein [Verrucomicrobiae bacterium]|jgi:uncharacterized protein YgbK (DUF1537 family)
MSRLRLTFYGDDFTGSTDALEQLTLAGIRAALFIEPPSKEQLARFKGLQAVGVAGMTRSMPPRKMETELRPALLKLKKLGAPHVHYKVCSTFDSSPQIGNIGRVIELAKKIFPAPFVPLLAAAPALGRFTVFGNHFARFGIGSAGAIHRLDHHPSISRHPVTPMTEADLRLHLAKQTKIKIALFDILKLSLPEQEMRLALRTILSEKPGAVLFDTLDMEHLARVGAILENFASPKRPLFSIGSSGIEAALATEWRSKPIANKLASPAKQILIGSGSCSPVTENQIKWALKNGFAEVPLDAKRLAVKNLEAEVHRATLAAIKLLGSGRSVIVHTTKNGPDKLIRAKLKDRSAKTLGTALGRVLREALAQTKVRRLCIAGGDTSSFAARALGIEALEMIAPLTPGAPLCRIHAPGSPADGLEAVFKGGQVGAINYFSTVLNGVHKRPSSNL